MTTAVLVKGRATQRVHFRIEVEGAAADLTGRELQVRMATPALASEQVLTATAATQSGATLGEAWFDVTTAQITALGAVSSAVIVINVWNVDGSLFLRRDAVFNLVL